jgi:lipopolysaccharide export LptBFGC system permease protein LptF
MNSAEREDQHPDWEEVAPSTGFQNLLALKRRFIIPAFLFFFCFITFAFSC